MKLLFDHNLSPRLIRRLVDLYPDASHVAAVGLDRASDIEVWHYRRIFFPTRAPLRTPALRRHWPVVVG